MLKVLFADNDGTIRIIAKKFIESHWDCKVLLAMNGPEALKMAAKEMPSLILLDVIMPGLDGIQTAQKLKEQGSKAPIIFVTAKPDMPNVGQFKDLGVISILVKPFEPRNLLLECSKVLDKK